MQSAADTDESLMLRYCDGDYAAFETLYHRHSRGLYRFISWHSRRPDWADEVAQEAWLSLHHARENYHPGAAFKTLLYQLARNRLIDLMRKQQVIVASDLGSNGDDVAVFDHLADRIQVVDSPDAGVAKNQLTRSLHQAIDRLPPEQKEALVLHRFSELSLSEIAQLTGAKEETVKARLRYAMQKLRQSIEA